MPPKINFIIPDFDKSTKDKVNDAIEVVSPTALRLPDKEGLNRSAISNVGFASKTDGVYVTAIKVHDMVNGYLTIGFTGNKTFDSTANLFAGLDPFSGMSLSCFLGCCWPGRTSCLDDRITQQSTEIITIFTISNDGKKKQVQWICHENEDEDEYLNHFAKKMPIQVVVDAKEGPVLDCTKHFGKVEEIFPCVSICDEGHHIEFIPFDQVKSRSPKIDELMKEFKSQHTQPILSVSSTSTAENDALVYQLREQVARSQDAALKDREQMIRDLRQRLAAKDIQHRDEQQSLAESNDKQLERIEKAHRTDLDLSHQQLELERAEHQKTRNLLHQIKMELKDMEIFYLNREKESGQRRQRDEGNEEFKVKQEPDVEQKKQETASKKTANKKK